MNFSDLIPSPKTLAIPTWVMKKAESAETLYASDILDSAKNLFSDQATAVIMDTAGVPTNGDIIGVWPQKGTTPAASNGISISW